MKNATGMEMVGVLSLGVAATFWKLFVIVHVWQLTMVKHLGAQPIGMFQAWALSWMIALFLVGYKTEEVKDKDPSHVAKKIVTYCATAAFSWGLAALIF